MMASSLIWCLAQAANQPAAGQEDNTFVLWAVLLLGLAVALFFVEVFLPSGGLIGAASAGCLVGGVVLLFKVDTTYGLIGATCAVIALPFALGFAIKLWPHTPIGRALTLRSPNDGAEEVVDDTDAGSAAPRPMAAPQPAVGTQGRAMTALRPVGVCLLDGRREECLAVGGTIEPGTEVEVVAVDGMHIRVRARG